MDLDMFSHLGEWTGNDWSNFFTILGGLAIIVGAIWTGIQFIRRRIARLEENIKANVKSCCRTRWRRRFSQWSKPR